MPSVRAEPPTQLAAHIEPARFSLRWYWAYARQMFSVFAFFTTALVVSTISAPVYLLFGRWFPSAVALGVIRCLFQLWLDMSIRLGVFDIQFPEAAKLSEMRGVIIAPNHPTMLDAIILLSIVPKTVCIMRASFKRSPFLGGAAVLAGFVTNDAGPALIRQGVDKIRGGENLLIFPEGTRTARTAVNAFKNGFALIAARSGAPVQTVFIEREASYLGKGVSLFAKTGLPIRYRFHLGDSARPRDGESAQEFASRLEEYFHDHLENSGEAIRLKSPLL